MGFFLEFLLKNHLLRAYYFRISLIWLDSFDSKWNSHYDRNSLVSNFWQKESTLRFSSQNLQMHQARTVTNFSRSSFFLLPPEVTRSHAHNSRGKSPAQDLIANSPAPGRYRVHACTCALQNRASSPSIYQFNSMSIIPRYNMQYVLNSLEWHLK